MSERWLPVVGFEGCYEVSDHGRVRSIRKGNNRMKRLQGKLLKGTVARIGYRYVSLYAGGKRIRKGRPVHRLVLEAFVGPPPPGHECLHADGNYLHNHLGNLRWGTRSENIQDALRHGNGHGGCRVPKTQDVVKKMRQMLKAGKSLREVGRYFGMNHTTIKRWARA